ncbi:MAG: hypothetical protein ACLPWS_12665 [Rhodomicrobium sp.]
MTDSSTGGYLAPAASPAPLQGAGLNNVIQQAIAGITGLAGTYVRPAFQAEPPDWPDAGTAWCAFRYQARPADLFPVIVHEGAAAGGNGQDELQRYESIDVLASFYDLGTTGQADYYAATLRDGLAIAQNREPLGALAIVLIKTGDLTAVPVLVKQRWMYRVDFTFTLRRTIQRDYPVLNLLGAAGTLSADTLPPLSQSFSS